MWAQCYRPMFPESLLRYLIRLWEMWGTHAACGQTTVLRQSNTSVAQKPAAEGGNQYQFDEEPNHRFRCAQPRHPIAE